MARARHTVRRSYLTLTLYPRVHVVANNNKLINCHRLLNKTPCPLPPKANTLGEYIANDVWEEVRRFKEE